MIKIFVNGSFDLLHFGHVCLLQQARELGDYLLVATDSDRRIRELKGPQRPIYTQSARVGMLQALAAVDRVEVFDSDQELRDIIRNYEPDVMIKGSDWKGHSIIGSEFCRSTKFIDRIEDYATTRTIQDIIAGRQLP
jgi:rfaE bifunctional protein nucleotidyltransferase chain/domain